MRCLRFEWKGPNGVKLGINLEFVRSADKPFEYGVREAARIGYRYVEPLVSTGYDLLAEAGFYHMLSMEEDPREIRDLCASVGVSIASVSGHSPLMKPEVAVHYLRGAIRWASDVGATVVNTDEGPKPAWVTDDLAFELMRYTLTKALATAERYGVDLALEPHQIYTQKLETFQRIMELVPSRRMKINFDTGNSYLAGHNPVEHLRALGPERVTHVHAKDISRDQGARERGAVTGTPVGCACGEGVIDWPAVVDVLAHAGFDGVISVECGTVEQAERSHAHLSGVLRAAGVRVG